MNEEAHERQQIAAVLEQYRLGFASAQRATLGHRHHCPRSLSVYVPAATRSFHSFWPVHS
jgi:hypothetical protein